MKGRRIHRDQQGFAVGLLNGPLQVLEARRGVVLQPGRAVEQFESGSQGDIQHIALRTVSLRYLLHIEEEQ